MKPAQLHNVTVYVEKSQLRTARDFYLALFGTEPIWEEGDHIACFGTAELAMCVHEEEAGRPAGTREFFLWADDLDAVRAELERAGRTVQRIATAGHYNELGAVDPMGNQVRVHRRPERPRVP
jgi:hypothetical protein